MSIGTRNPPRQAPYERSCNVSYAHGASNPGLRRCPRFPKGRGPGHFPKLTGSNGGTPQDSTKIVNGRCVAGQYSVAADEMTEDMTRNDLVYVLQNLRFAKHGGGGSKQIWLDQGVRDYLVRASSR